jgi:hypothetical protein
MRNDAMDITGRANTDKMPLTQAERLELAEERKKEAALKWVSYDCKIHGQYTFREDRKPRCRKCVETGRVDRIVKQNQDRPAEQPAIIKELSYHEVEIDAVEIGVRKIHDIIRVDKALAKGNLQKAVAFGKEFLTRQYGTKAKDFVDVSVKIMG